MPLGLIDTGVCGTLGLATQNILGHPAASHAGAIDGFQSSLVYFSDQDVAIAIITNALPAPPGGNLSLIGVAVAKAALHVP